MNSLLDVIRLVRAGHGTRTLHGLLREFAAFAVASIVIVAFSARVAHFIKSRSGMAWASNEMLMLTMFTCMLLFMSWNIARVRRLAMAEGLRITRAKGLCRGCLYPLMADSQRCSECGLEPWGPAPPPPPP